VQDGVETLAGHSNINNIDCCRSSRNSVVYLCSASGSGSGSGSVSGGSAVPAARFTAATIRTRQHTGVL